MGDDEVEVVVESREALQREGHGAVPLRRHDAELPALRLESREHREQVVEGLERLVQAVVVLLVRLQELVRVLGVDRLHLRDDPLAADGEGELLVGNLASEHRRHGVPHRREDDRPGVDERAVEVEEDDAVAHAPDASQYVMRSR